MVEKKKIQFLIKARSVKGFGLGRKLAFPTINLPYSGLERGVYIAEALIGELYLPAVVNLGMRPSIDGRDLLCEAHILNWSGEFEYGEFVELRFYQKIRDEKKFLNLDALKEQISKDVKFAVDWYNLQ